MESPYCKNKYIALQLHVNYALNKPLLLCVLDTGVYVLGSECVLLKSSQRETSH